MRQIGRLEHPAGVAIARETDRDRQQMNNISPTALKRELQVVEVETPSDIVSLALITAFLGRLSRTNLTWKKREGAPKSSSVRS